MKITISTLLLISAHSIFKNWIGKICRKYKHSTWTEENDSLLLKSTWKTNMLSLIKRYYHNIRIFCLDHEISNPLWSCGKFLKYLKRLINEFNKVEELLEQFEDTTLNEGSIIELPSCKGLDIFWYEKLNTLQTMLKYQKIIMLMQMYILCQHTLSDYLNIYHI